MAVLERFDTPGRLPEPSVEDAQAWSDRVAALFSASPGDFPQLYDPTVIDTPDDHQVVPIIWAAFPATLLPGATSEEGRWREADRTRQVQDEYCEWGVERNADAEVTGVTFTTELPEYFEHLAVRRPDRLRDLYRDLVGADVELDDLIADGAYQRVNRWNDPDATDRPPVHLVHGPNTLGAAVSLVAVATHPRERDGELITTKATLAQCAGLGDPRRNSDPQIAAIVNGAARAGHEITLQDPIGLYIHGLSTVGMATPDGADPANFWTIERGTREHALRASFTVPKDRDYVVGDITSNGRRITSGAQLADRVTIRISGVVKPADHRLSPRPCD